MRIKKTIRKGIAYIIALPFVVIWTLTWLLGVLGEFLKLVENKTDYYVDEMAEWIGNKLFDLFGE